jgi:hypothetical protein
VRVHLLVDFKIGLCHFGPDRWTLPIGHILEHP